MWVFGFYRSFIFELILNLRVTMWILLDFRLIYDEIELYDVDFIGLYDENMMKDLAMK